MQANSMISTTDFCVAHHIDIAFIVTLKQKGLITMEGDYIPIAQLAELEKLVCFYYELDINLGGIETINHLLQRIKSLQQELRRVKIRLRNYENELPVQSPQTTLLIPYKTMKRYRQLGIWMDYSSAILMDYHDDVIDESRISCDFTNEDKIEGLHKSEKMMHHKQKQLQASYFRKIGEVIRHFNTVLIMGQSEAKFELKNLLEADPLFHDIRINVQTVDHLAINQVHAFVRDYFDK